MISKRRVLFVCTANSARSLIAEAMLRSLAGDEFEVFSAGTHPTGVDGRALDALNRQGIDTRGLTSKSVDTFLNSTPFDFVITVCDKARQECAEMKGVAETLHWNIPDPKTRTDSDPFFKTVLEIGERIKMFVLIKTRKD